MFHRRPNPATFEALEGRLLMATANPSPALPYSILTMPGRFEAAVPVTVTFQGRHHGPISVPISVPIAPASVNAVTVAVPFFLDSKQRAPGAETVKVTAMHGHRSVASLPETGLPAGTLLAETAAELHAVIGDVLKSLLTEIPPPRPLVSTPPSPLVSTPPPRPLVPTPPRPLVPTPPSPVEITTLQLLAIDQGLINLEAGIAPVLAGTAKSVTLGTFHGKPAVIDSKALRLIDRGIAAVVEDPTGTSATRLTGPALAGGLLKLINGALAGGRPTILGAAGRLVNVLSTGPATQGFPVGPLVTGLVLGDTVALIAVAEAEVGSYSGRNTQINLGNYQQVYVEGNFFFQAANQFLASPILPMTTAAIETGFKPASTSAAGKAILGLAHVDDGLAHELSRAPGTLGEQLVEELSNLVL